MILLQYLLLCLYGAEEQVCSGPLQVTGGWTTDQSVCLRRETRDGMCVICVNDYLLPCTHVTQHMCTTHVHHTLVLCT